MRIVTLISVLYIYLSMLLLSNLSISTHIYLSIHKNMYTYTHVFYKMKIKTYLIDNDTLFDRVLYHEFYCV